MRKIKWQNPRDKIWGFHIHQELSLDDFDRALVIQKNCFEFLTSLGVKINDTDSMKPGYGPHLNYIWDLRVEKDNDPLEKMGLAIAYLAINRFGLSAYIHPLMTDKNLDPIAYLNSEGEENQKNILWFSHSVPHHQEFFFNPPLDDKNEVIDTRQPRILTAEEKQQLYKVGIDKLKNEKFQNPLEKITNGFHLHLDYLPEEEELALKVFDEFLFFLLKEGMRPSRTRIYEAFDNGPHIRKGWEVKFEGKGLHILKQFGIAVGWLMCNRQGLPIFAHPVTWEHGNRNEELNAHENYAMFIGNLPPLNLNFFKDQIKETGS